jgi:hypothetical protein
MGSIVYSSGNGALSIPRDTRTPPHRNKDSQGSRFVTLTAIRFNQGRQIAFHLLRSQATIRVEESISDASIRPTYRGR